MYCGTEIMLQEVIKKVEILNAPKIENYIKLAKRSFKDSQYAEAYDYYNKALELDPDNWEAIYKKGLCGAWQSSLANFRIGEAVKAAKNALHVIKTYSLTQIDPGELKLQFASDITRIAVKLGNWAANHYNQYWESENAASEYWDRLDQCTQALLYVSGLLNDQITDKNHVAQDVKIQILKKIVIWCCEICEYRKYKSGYLNGNPTYTKTWIKLEYRNKTVQLYNECVQKIKEYDSAYVPMRIKQKEPASCYVATAVYGSYDCPPVWTLRRFRDGILAHTWHGRLFIKFYYAASPKILNLFGKTACFNRYCKMALDQLVGKLNAKGISDSFYND